jgi:hypothetical protein
MAHATLCKHERDSNSSVAIGQARATIHISHLNDELIQFALNTTFFFLFDTPGVLNLEPCA